jgi:hypothetical protein
MKPSLLAFAITSLALAACAQDAPPAATADSEAPATLVGQRARALLVGEPNGPNYLTGGVTVIQMYTDNARLTSTGNTSNLSYDIQPEIALNHAGPRLTYSMAASAGFVVNRDLQEQNQATQGGSLDLTYNLRPFTTIRISDSFTNTTGLWAGPSAGAGAGGNIGAAQQPNQSLLTYGRFWANTALAELNHQFTLNGSGGLRATHFYTWFPDQATSPVVGAIYGGQTYSAEAFYNLRISSRQWIGTTLRAQRFDVGRPFSRTDSGSLLLLYGIDFREGMTLSLFAGPELSVTSNQGLVPTPTIVPTRMWSPVTGAVFSRAGRNTAATVSFVRQVSDGGGLPSAVTLSYVHGDVLRQLTHRIAMEVGFGYAHGTPIIGTQTIRTYSGYWQCTYRVGRNYVFSTGYSRDDNTAAASNTSASANRVWVSFAYNFMRPLGR